MFANARRPAAHPCIHDVRFEFPCQFCATSCPQIVKRLRSRMRAAKIIDGERVKINDGVQSFRLRQVPVASSLYLVRRAEVVLSVAELSYQR